MSYTIEIIDGDNYDLILVEEQGPTGAAGATGPIGPQGPAGTLPSMTGQSGKYLTNNGTIESWGIVDLASYATTASVVAGYIPLATSIANRIPKRSGTTGLLTDSGITIDASNNVTGVAAITASGSIISTNLLGVGTASPVSYLSGVFGAAIYSASNAGIAVANASRSYLWYVSGTSLKLYDNTGDRIEVTNSVITLNAATVAVNGNITATGAITGSNLSNTNTGDQDLSSYATTASVVAGYIPLSTSVANRIPKRSGTTGLLTDSGITIDASNNVTGVAELTAIGTMTLLGTAGSSATVRYNDAFAEWRQTNSYVGNVIYGGYAWYATLTGGAQQRILVLSGLGDLTVFGTVSAAAITAGAGTFSDNVTVGYAKKIQFTSGGSVGNVGGFGGRLELFGNVVNIGAGVNGNVANLLLGDYATTSMNIYGTAAFTATLTVNAGDLLNPGTGNLLVLRGGNANGAFNGGNVRLHGGTFGSSGTNGNVILAHTGSVAQGRVLIGTATDDGTNLLQVAGSITASGTVSTPVIQIGNISGYIASGAALLSGAYLGNNDFAIRAQNKFGIAVGGSNVPCLTIDAAGAVTASGSIAAASLNLGGSTVTDILTATATLNFASILAGGFEDLTIAVTGAALGSTAIANPPVGSVTNNITYDAWVSAAGVVTVRASNNNLITAMDPASGTFRATVFNF